MTDNNGMATPMSVAVNYWESVNTRNFDAIDAILSPSLVTEKGKTREGILSDLKTLSGGFPDLHFNVDNVFADGANVAVRWTMTGTHTAPFGPYTQPTGRKVEQQGVALFRVDNGVITEFWPGADRSKMAQMLGTAPVQTGIPSKTPANPLERLVLERSTGNNALTK